MTLKPINEIVCKSKSMSSYQIFYIKHCILYLGIFFSLIFKYTEIDIQFNPNIYIIHPKASYQNYTKIKSYIYINYKSNSTNGNKHICQFKEVWQRIFSNLGQGLFITLRFYVSVSVTWLSSHHLSFQRRDHFIRVQHFTYLLTMQ